MSSGPQISLTWVWATWLLALTGESAQEGRDQQVRDSSKPQPTLMWHWDCCSLQVCHHAQWRSSSKRLQYFSFLWAIKLCEFTTNCKFQIKQNVMGKQKGPASYRWRRKKIYLREPIHTETGQFSKTRGQN